METRNMSKRKSKVEKLCMTFCAKNKKNRRKKSTEGLAVETK